MLPPCLSAVAVRLLALGALALAGCGRPTLFQLESPRRTGVAFVNRVPDSEDFAFLHYDGGGVAVGNVNADGLPDLCSTSNAGKNRLYLNRGGFHPDRREHVGLS